MYEANFGKKSNRETWSETIQVVDENGDDADISSATVNVAVKQKGLASTDAPNLEATNSDGVTVSSPNFTFTFAETDMDGLDAGFYDVGVTVTAGVLVAVAVGVGVPGAVGSLENS